MLKAQESTAKIRQLLDTIYNKTGGKVEEIKSLSDTEVLELAGNLTDGVPTATPVFDGATEAEIKGLLEYGRARPRPVSPPCTTVVRASASIGTLRSATCTC